MEEIINEMDGLFKQVVKYYPMKDLAETKRQWNSLVSEFKNCSIPDVGLSLPDEDEINSMRLEMDCPTPNEEEYATAGFKSGVRWLKNTIERQLQGQ